MYSVGDTRGMRILLDKVGPCLDEGNTAPLENLLLSIVEYIERQEKKEDEQKNG